MANQASPPNPIKVLSAQFEAQNVDFYEIDGDIWLTRDQIGRALGYTDPRNAIFKIHQRHSERLDKFSGVVNLSTPGGPQSTVIYSMRGVYEICRYSEQPQAHAFFDWVWDVLETLRLKGYYALSNHVATVSSISSQDIHQLQRLIAELRTAIAQSPMLTETPLRLTVQEVWPDAPNVVHDWVLPTERWIIREDGIYGRKRPYETVWGHPILITGMRPGQVELTFRDLHRSWESRWVRQTQALTPHGVIGLTNVGLLVGNPSPAARWLERQMVMNLSRLTAQGLSGPEDNSPLDTILPRSANEWNEMYWAWRWILRHPQTHERLKRLLDAWPTDFGDFRSALDDLEVRPRADRVNPEVFHKIQQQFQRKE
ncbi:hypothetical protein TPY_2766 [Sulfobacillus acidophilus TPY]|uniref:Prophage antirepressor n=1 Tax=Sulfobacillus acidophilus (strain ATCC 700253 / DSM 10332 / NAL) TaxID=679936 RepID=G8TU22_SULAD|nr:hypothetical protein TPY_2766 [Sulfobacillus acidophilus TPY]AEW04613.1 prophage antirepressor [Sulfobacillus acidophilus DSM 10332]